MSKDCTIQDVFHRFYSSFESTHDISPAQRKAAYHIMNCKTGAFGVNVSVCEDCGCISVHYNSCRDRCCPMCQEFPKEKWVDARREDILDAPYFHVVFTVPEELNPIIYSNQKFLYTALYHAASDTLSELAADSKYLGTDIGYICILHTWGSTMNFHPHIHAIVLGGGLDVKNHWKDNGKEFFLPIKVISKIFRGKYMAELKQHTNWYFESIDKQLGSSTINSYLQQIGYGNKNISGDFSSYWMQSSLKISPVEQVELLKNLYRNNFNFTPANIHAVKNSIHLTASENGEFMEKPEPDE